MKQQKFNFEYMLLAISILFAIVSLSIDLWSDSKIWFSRSGSILVLFSVIVEYRIASFIYDDIQKILYLNGRIELPVPLKPQPQKEKVIVSKISHFLIVAGTLIWGYGDLLLK